MSRPLLYFVIGLCLLLLGVALEVMNPRGMFGELMAYAGVVCLLTSMILFVARKLRKGT